MSIRWKTEPIEVSQEQIMAEMAAYRKAVKETQDAGIPALMRLYKVRHLTVRKLHPFCKSQKA